MVIFFNSRCRPSLPAILLLLAVSCSRKPPGAAEKTTDCHLAPRLKNIGNLQYFNQGLTLVYAFNHSGAFRSF